MVVDESVYVCLQWMGGGVVIDESMYVCLFAVDGRAAVREPDS